MEEELRVYRKTQKVDLIVIILLVHFAMSYATLLYDGFRYLKYTLPFLALILQQKNASRQKELWMIKSNKYLQQYLKFYLVVFFIFFIRQIFLNELSFRFIANVLFVILPLTLAYVIFPSIQARNVKLYVKILSFGTVIGFILEQHSTIIPTILSISSLFTGITDSEVETESAVYSYLLAVILVFSMYFRHSKIIAYLVLFCVILSFKRIIFLALALVFVLSKMPFIISFLRRRPKLSSLIFASASLLLITIYYQVVAGQFDEIIFSTFGLSTNAMLKGRQQLYTLALRDFDGIKLFIGNGIGFVDNLLLNNQASVNHVKNLHSELLRWFIETGAIVYFLWIYISFKNSTAGKFSLIFYIFIFIMLLTDNVFIHFDTMFYFYLLTLFSFIAESGSIRKFRQNVNSLRKHIPA